MSQKCLHQRMLNTTIVKNFTIVLQYNSNFRIVLQHNSKKKIYILFHLCLLRKFLFALSGTSFPFSLFVLRISICSIVSSDPNSSQHQHQHHTPSSIAKLNRFTLTLSIAEASHGVSSQTHLQIPLPIHPHPQPI